MESKIFISYSSKDTNFANFLYEEILSNGYSVYKDDKVIKGGGKIEKEVNRMILDSDIMIVVLSNDSLDSEWVAYETSRFLFRKSKEPNLKIIPILIDECNVSEMFSNYKIINATNPSNYNKTIVELLSSINNSKSYSNSINAPFNTFKVNAELESLKKMIHSAVSKGTEEFKIQLDSLTQTIQKQQYILAPSSIAIKEETAYEQIWVLTTHLFNDVYDPDIRESVTKNFERGLHYKYFVIETPLINERKKKYVEKYSKYDKNYEFITLQDGMVLPFDEIVLYDPLDPTRLWGYMQIKYKINNNEEDDIFIKLSDIHASTISNSLKIKAYPKNK